MRNSGAPHAKHHKIKFKKGKRKEKKLIKIMRLIIKRNTILKAKKEKPGYIIPPSNQGLFAHFGV